MTKSIDVKVESTDEEILSQLITAFLPFCPSNGKASTEKVRELINHYNFSSQELEEIKKSLISGAMLHLNNYQISGSETSKEIACRYLAVTQYIDDKLECVVMY